MNWFTHSTITDKTNKTAKVAELHDVCEHVQEDNSKLVKVSYENDSFGSESYGMCQECWDKAQEAEAEQEENCTDCNQVFKMKELKEWKWYDFSYQQGDEPHLLCEGCRSAEKHIERVRKDKADYESEFGRDEDDDNFYG